MIRILGFRQSSGGVEGFFSEEWSGVPTPDEYARLQPSAWKAAWIDLDAPGKEELAWIQREFRFHPLAIEDCAHFDQRPKFEEYPGHLFVVVHGLRALPDWEIGVFELHSFLTPKLVVTVHDGSIDVLSAFIERVEREPSAFPNQPDHMLHRIFEVAMRSNPRVLDQIESWVEHLEEEISQKRKRDWPFERVHELMRNLSTARRYMAPQVPLFSTLIHRKSAEISESASLYFRNTHDHLIRMLEQVDFMRESLWSIHEAFSAQQAERSNETMKRLTAFSVIFLPLTFITGFFGMNFQDLPFASSSWYAFTTGTVITLPLCMILWFRLKRWI